MQEIPRHVIIGTAGHVDHGKTALVKALTGVDADTLAEEKRRGITIELGFVFMDVPPGTPQVVFIDVPGHEKLIRTMVAGASSLQAAMLVIAADEGVQPQTQEHADILRLLGVTQGVVALTKCDLVDTARLAQVTAEVHRFVAQTSLATAPIVPVSAVSGDGVEDLRRALCELAAALPPRSGSGAFRMPVDRVFTLHGFGTVIAGTVLAGVVRPGDRVTVYPEQLEGRVRTVQVHGQTVEASSVGQRTALNIPDIPKESLRRGQCAAAPGSLTPTTRLDVRLLLLPGHLPELKHRDRLRVHVGTEEVIARVVLLDRDRLSGGDEAPAQLLLESPTVALHGDRFVARTLSPLITVGGGVILDPNPERHRRRAEETLAAFDRMEGTLADRIEQIVLKADTEGQTASQVAQALGGDEAEVAAAMTEMAATGQLVGVGSTPTESARYLHTRSYEALVRQVLQTVEDYLLQHRYRTYMPAADLQSRLADRAPRAMLVAVLRDLRRQGRLLVTPRGCALPDRELPLTTVERELVARLERTYQQAGTAPPAEETVREELSVTPSVFANLMEVLLDQGQLVRLPGKVTIHAEALGRAQEVVSDALAKQGSIAVGEARDRLACSRKHAVALLEYFDGTGLTRRVEDRRVPGPKFSGEV